VTTASPHRHPPLLQYGPWLLIAAGLVAVGVYVDPLIAVALGGLECLTGAGFGLANRLGRGGAEITARVITSYTKLTDEALGEVVADLLWGIQSIDGSAWDEHQATRLMSLYDESVTLTAASARYRPVHQAAAALLLAHVVRQRETARPGPKSGTTVEWQTVCDEIRDELRQIAAALPEDDAIRQAVERGLTPATRARVAAA
jgi:hypothetical protein